MICMQNSKAYVICNAMPMDCNFQTMPDNVTKLVLSRFDDNSLYCRINLKNKFIVPNPYTLNTYSFDFKKHVYCVLAAYGDQLLISNLFVSKLSTKTDIVMQIVSLYYFRRGQGGRGWVTRDWETSRERDLCRIH